jgi:putative restriction endonuclease
MQNEFQIRMAAFRWLKERESFGQHVFRGTDLATGFMHEGVRITLKGQTGIWFPRGWEIPLSITTRKDGPYPADRITADGSLTYAYRGTDPHHRDNEGLRRAMRTRTPLIYFNEIRDHWYEAAWPVIIVFDDPRALCVTAMVEPAYIDLARTSPLPDDALSPLDVRRYVTVQTRHRLHQTAFRELVINAYDEHCAVCRLHHPELLDAAHIIPDSDERGEPIVSNGLSLCKIHHAAYDQSIIGIDQDCRVHIRRDILEERDGPMLRHGLQELDGSTLTLPARRRDHPDRDRLKERFSLFLSA